LAGGDTYGSPSERMVDGSTGHGLAVPYSGGAEGAFDAPLYRRTRSLGDTTGIARPDFSLAAGPPGSVPSYARQLQATGRVSVAAGGSWQPQVPGRRPAMSAPLRVESAYNRILSAGSDAQIPLPSPRRVEHFNTITAPRHVLTASPRGGAVQRRRTPSIQSARHAPSAGAELPAAQEEGAAAAAAATTTHAYPRIALRTARAGSSLAPPPRSTRALPTQLQF
jgi:hypothetical protein